jgi:formate dehydrogenase major subunit
MTAIVTVTVDGLPVSVPEGTSVLLAAAEAGVAIPKLCATESLEAFGSCRLCLVEVDGLKGTPASCTTRSPTAWRCTRRRRNWRSSVAG